jgi:hypothetical protein
MLSRYHNYIQPGLIYAHSYSLFHLTPLLLLFKCLRLVVMDVDIVVVVFVVVVLLF